MQPESTTPKSQLRREMGFWDVLLFNIAAVLGPRWIAAAAHNGTSSISLWILAAVLFFLPTALIIIELSTRYPAEGGLYVWSKEAFGDFHGFVAGWSYWIYTFFYFPGLLSASVAMSVYIGGPKYAWLADSKSYILGTSLGLLAIAVALNLVGLNIGKWLQNAGGVGTYVPLLMLLGIAGYIALHYGRATHFSWRTSLPTWNWGTVNFWSQIAFAFTGMELVCAMSEEVHEPRKTFPRAIYASAVLIALIYVVGTIAVLALRPAEQIDVRTGVFQAITDGSTRLAIGWFGILAALLVTAGNAGGVGATVAGVARIPFVAGIDRYLPAFFGKIHPRWKTPYLSILVQAGFSALILILTQYVTGLKNGYLFLVDMSVILYFIPFLYMYAAVIKLAYRPERYTSRQAVLIPGGRPGVWTSGVLGFVVTLGSMVLAAIPPDTALSKVQFEVNIVFLTAAMIGGGLFLYFRRQLPTSVKWATAIGFADGLLWVWAWSHLDSKLTLVRSLGYITCPLILLVGAFPYLVPFFNAVIYGAVGYLVTTAKTMITKGSQPSVR